MTLAELVAFGQVVGIDLLLAGDNAIVIGALAAGLPPAQRQRVILLGLAVAVVARIGFALIAVWLMSIVGLVLAGGVLLLWVAWKMWRELAAPAPAAPADSPVAEFGRQAGDVFAKSKPQRSFWAAAFAVTVADITMSLDNVLGVAGAAREHPAVLVLGLLLSVALMGGAATVIARYIEKYRGLTLIGLALIIFVALRMIWEGGHQLLVHFA